MDLTSSAVRSFIETSTFDPSAGAWSDGSAFPVELKDVVALLPSPSGRALATIRRVGAGADTKYFVEVWVCACAWRTAPLKRFPARS
jgi:hypothetical protein